MSADAERISRVIFQYGARIWRENDKGAQLATIASMTRDLVGADRCTIWIVDKPTGDIVTRVADGIQEIRIASGQGLVGSCIATGEVLIVNNPAADPRFSNVVDRSSGYSTQSILTVPLRGAAGDVIGACQLLNKPGGFQPPDVDLVGLASSFSAEAIENLELQKIRDTARRIQLELEIAREVQRDLLPRAVPDHPWVECAAAFRPVFHIGGDYYNFWPLKTGNFAIALGDIAGKGIPAALLMASVQASLSSQLRQGCSDEAAMIADLSQMVYESSAAGRYSTLFFAQYDPRAGTLTYVNAGQAPPVLHRAASGKFHRLREGGVPIGLLPAATYERETVPFGAGDTLICFSDGISESLNADDDEWGDDRLIEAAREGPSLSAAALTEVLMQQAEAFAGGAKQHDDMTVLVLRPRVTAG